jgi:3-polyprenyl-4-hydroxybenzoate decarboxylase
MGLTKPQLTGTLLSATRVWCSGSTAAFQASGISSNLITRSKNNVTLEKTRGFYFIPVRWLQN